MPQVMRDGNHHKAHHGCIRSGKPRHPGNNRITPNIRSPPFAVDSRYANCAAKRSHRAISTMMAETTGRRMLSVRETKRIGKSKMKRTILILGGVVFGYWFLNFLVPDSIFTWRTWAYWEPNHGRAISGFHRVGDQFACGLGDTHKYLWTAVQHRRWAEIWGTKWREKDRSFHSEVI